MHLLASVHTATSGFLNSNSDITEEFRSKTQTIFDLIPEGVGSITSIKETAPAVED